MSKERIILVAAGVICAGLLVTALLVPRSQGPAAPGSAPPGPGIAGTEGVPGAAAPEASPTGSPEAAAAPAAAASPSAAPSPSPAEEGFLSEQNRRDVTLFFQESEGEDLGPEKRKIFLTSSPADQAKQIVVELINGPREPNLLPTLPPETRLLGLYLDRAGTAWVDLSQDLVDHHPGGTSEELATIFSLVDSLAFNLPEVKRVHFLIGGEERDTLKDHLDLRRDYLPDLSIVHQEGKR